MKTMTSLSLSLSGVLLALSAAACSASAAAPPAQASVAQGVAAGGGRHDPSALIARLDANKDGKLQVTELPERMQARLADADTDQDGVLSLAELTAHRTKAKQDRFAHEDKNGDGALDATEVGDKKWGYLQIADANKDGKITLAEIESARAAGTLQAHGGHHERGDRNGKEGHERPTVDGLISRLDANKDGVLQTSEIPERMRPWLEKADANKDGVITKEELQAAHDAHQRDGGDHGR